MWGQLLVALLMQVVAYMLQASAKPRVDPPEPGQLDVPTVKEGEQVRVVFGSILIKDATIIYTGDNRAEPIYSEGGGKKG